jgi:glycopeptide antibiotics resistance protein
MKRVIPTFFLIVYSALLIKVMVYKDLPTFKIGQLMINLGGTNGGHPPNFIPLNTIIPYLFSEQGFLIAGVNLLGNVALLVPVGLLIPLVFKNITWKKSLILAIFTGLSIEVMQVVTNLGIFDVDDIILNALGVMAGYWACILAAEWIRSKKYKNIAIAAIVLIVAIATSLYILYPKGQSVVSPADRVSSQGEDPCGKTRGTGQIVNIASSSITIKRNDDSLQKIDLTAKTSFRTSEGAVSKSELRENDRVTVVVDDSETAATVLVCGVSN